MGNWDPYTKMVQWERALHTRRDNIHKVKILGTVRWITGMGGIG